MEVVGSIKRVVKNKLIEKIFVIIFLIIFVAIFSINIVEQLNAEEYLYKQSILDYTKIANNISEILSESEDIDSALSNLKARNNLVGIVYKNEVTYDTFSLGDFSATLTSEGKSSISKGGSYYKVSKDSTGTPLMNIWVPLYEDRTVSGVVGISSYLDDTHKMEAVMDSLLLVFGSSILWSVVIVSIINNLVGGIK
jgi:hypothetical protein